MRERGKDRGNVRASTNGPERDFDAGRATDVAFPIDSHALSWPTLDPPRIESVHTRRTTDRQRPLARAGSRARIGDHSPARAFESRGLIGYDSVGVAMQMQ
jgi:hypothetical protein